MFKRAIDHAIGRIVWEMEGVLANAIYKALRQLRAEDDEARAAYEIAHPERLR